MYNLGSITNYVLQYDQNGVNDGIVQFNTILLIVFILFWLFVGVFFL